MKKVSRILLFTLIAALVAGTAFTNASADGIPGLPGPFGSAVQGGIGAVQGGTGGSLLCATPEGSINFENNSICFFETSTGFSSGSLSRMSTGTGNFAQASLGEGFLSVGASGNYFVPSVGFGDANASAVVWDTLIFSGAAPGATATIVMTGTVGSAGFASTNAAAFLGTLAPGASAGEAALLLVGGGESFPISTEPTYSLEQTFPIFNDQPMVFEVAVSAGAAECGTSCSGQAFITDPFSLDLPSGVTFTSASGEFPGTTVPEPSSLMLLATGLLGVFWRRKQLSERATRPRG
jgi:hypothetical protein